jgi:hypothetical protein
VTLAKEFECLAKEKMDDRAGLIRARYIDRYNHYAKTPKELIENEDALTAKFLCEKIFELCTI